MRFDDAVKPRAKKPFGFKFGRFMSYKTEGRQTVVGPFLIPYFITIFVWSLRLKHWCRTSTQIQTERSEETVPRSVANRAGLVCLLLMFDAPDITSLFIHEKVLPLWSYL